MRSQYSESAKVWAVWGKNPERIKNFISFLGNLQTDYGAHPTFYSVGIGFLFRCCVKLATHICVVPRLE